MKKLLLITAFLLSIKTVGYCGLFDDDGGGSIAPNVPIGLTSNASPTGYVISVSSQSGVNGKLLTLQGNGKFSVANGTATQAGFIVDPTTRFVGVGTSTPAVALHVIGRGPNPKIRLEVGSPGSGAASLDLVSGAATSNSQINMYAGPVANSLISMNIQAEMTQRRVNFYSNAPTKATSNSFWFAPANQGNIVVIGTGGVMGVGYPVVYPTALFELQSPATITPSSFLFQITSQTYTTKIFGINARGAVIVGTPTGGDKGPGTINAVAVYDDGAGPLTDYVFDQAFDGKVDWRKYGNKIRNFDLLSIDQMSRFIQKERRLPAMPDKSEWEKNSGASLGRLVQGLWETIETQAIYIKELNERLNRLEKFRQ